jgi:hypothetical protein
MKRSSVCLMVVVGLCGVWTDKAGAAEFSSLLSSTNLSVLAEVPRAGLNSGISVSPLSYGVSRQTLPAYLENDTTTPYYGFVVDLYVNKSFSLSGISLGTEGWSLLADSVVAPHLSASPVYYGANEWSAEFVIYSATPLLEGDGVDFTYTITYSLGSGVSAELTYTPITQAVIVPEPGVIALAALGGVMLVARKRS